MEQTTSDAFGIIEHLMPGQRETAARFIATLYQYPDAMLLELAVGLYLSTSDIGAKVELLKLIKKFM